jgi:hypothetical protein
MNTLDWRGGATIACFVGTGLSASGTEGKVWKFPSLSTSDPDFRIPVGFELRDLGRCWQSLHRVWTVRRQES